MKLQPTVPQSPLTQREKQVLDLAVQGATAKQIANSLAITPRTARFHLSAIYRKLDVSNQLELVAKTRLSDD